MLMLPNPKPLNSKMFLVQAFSTRGFQPYTVSKFSLGSSDDQAHPFAEQLRTLLLCLLFSLFLWGGGVLGGTELQCLRTRKDMSQEGSLVGLRG